MENDHHGQHQLWPVLRPDAIQSNTLQRVEHTPLKPWRRSRSPSRTHFSQESRERCIGSRCSRIHWVRLPLAPHTIRMSVLTVKRSRCVDGSDYHDDCGAPHCQGAG